VRTRDPAQAWSDIVISKNNEEPREEDSLGVLDDTASIDTTAIGILSGTAQVSVTLPQEEDDDLADDGVLDGEVIVDLIVDEAPLEVVTPVAAAKPAAISITVPIAAEDPVEPVDGEAEHVEPVVKPDDDLHAEVEAQEEEIGRGRRCCSRRRRRGGSTRCAGRAGRGRRRAVGHDGCIGAGRGHR
jgi:hypothetical protein